MSKVITNRQFLRSGHESSGSRTSLALAGAMLLGSVAPVLGQATPIGTPLTPVIKLSNEPYIFEQFNNVNLVARDAAGDFAVAWQIETSASPLTELDYIGWFSPTGAPLTAPVLLSGPPLQVAMDDAGDTFVRTGCFGFAANTCVTVYGLNGSIITPEFGLPLPSSSTITSGARMAVTGSGQILFAWNNDTQVGSSYSVETLTQTYNLDGTPVGTSQVIHQNTYPFILGLEGLQGPFALGMNRSTGAYAVLFADQLSPRIFQLRIFTPGGKPTSATVRLPTGAGTLPVAITPPGEEYGAINVAVTRAGDVICAFVASDTAGPAIYTYRYSARGVLKDGPIKVVSGNTTLNYGRPILSAQGLVDTVDNGFMLTYPGLETIKQGGGAVVPLTTSVYNSSDKLVKTFTVAKEALVPYDAPAAVSSVVDAQGNLRVVWGEVDTQLFQGP